MNQVVTIVESKNDFWSLAGSLRSTEHLTDSQLKLIRKTFANIWARSV